MAPTNAVESVDVLMMACGNVLVGGCVTFVVVIVIVVVGGCCDMFVMGNRASVGNEVGTLMRSICWMPACKFDNSDSRPSRSLRPPPPT